MQFGMRHMIVVVALAQMATQAPAEQNALPSDVPEKHWAAGAVRDVVASGVMTALSGRFDGGRKVTRSELVTIIARTARALEARSWPSSKPVPLPGELSAAKANTAPVTRYVAAAVLARVVPYALAGLPKQAAARPQTSAAIPEAPRLPSVKNPTPAHRELQYLAQRRLVWPKSPLLNPGKQVVTGQQLSDALSQMIAGLNARMTAEPEDQPELTRPSR